MQRRKFIEIGGLLAASFAPLHSLAGRPAGYKSDPGRLPVDFIYDGTELSPKEYADLLMKLVDAGKIKTDSYSLGGVVEELEQKFATLLGKESAVFMPTGTLANHIAVRKLAGNNRKVIVQEQSHLYNDCGDCAETLSGLNLVPVAENQVGFSLADLVRIAEKTSTGRVETKIGAISIETPVRRKQDRIFRYEDIKPISEYAKNNGIKTHLDGARLFVQSVHTGVSPAAYGDLFDTVYTSLYKCFNAPAGAVLAGTKSFTSPLFHERRMFGGGLPAAWPFAAIALHYADGFMEDYGSAWKNALAFFAALGKEERFTVSQLDNGTHVVRLDIKSANLVRFRELLQQKNIHLSKPDEKGFYLKVNPTMNRVQAGELAALFIGALSESGLSKG